MSDLSGAYPTSVVNASALRLRSEPTTTSEVLAALPRGAVVEVIDGTPDGVWKQVHSGQRTGWMASKYLIAPDHPAAPNASNEEFPWMAVALHEVGVHETPGITATARVTEYLQSTELDHALALSDETPWCSGFVNWCIEKSGLAGTNSAAAKSWLDWGRPLILPRRGCIAVFDRYPSGGHVGFFMATSAIGTLAVLGGNQSNSVCVRGYPSDRLLGYRVAAR